MAIGDGTASANCLSKAQTPHGTYTVNVCGENYGSYRSRIEANEVCRRVRREVKDDFDIPFVL
jgi:hypothetical protein